MLRQLDHIPDGLLQLDAHELYAKLGGPTLIHLSGRRTPALFVSVLMHGNETTGWSAMRQLLQTRQRGTSDLTLPRALSLFIANPEAAKYGVRHLPEQPDFNRIWPGSELPHTAEGEMIQEVVNIMRDRGLFASIDVHNNTGLNPHYACVNRLDARSLHLATLFGRTVVYFTKPVGVQSLAMTQLCPAVTLECGKIGQSYGVAHTREYIDACLHLSKLPEHRAAPHDIDLYHTTAIVKIADRVKFGYDGDHLDLRLMTELEHYNFRELKRGTPFGEVALLDQKVLNVTDEEGADVYDRYFETSASTIRTRRPVMPSMLTPDTKIIEQDCLCYLMERFEVA